MNTLGAGEYMWHRLYISVAVVLLLGVTAKAQTSVYSSMSVAGDWQGFNPSHNNMYLISDHVWEGVFFINHRPANAFKFVANGSWGFNLNWGAFITSAVPIVSTASLVNVFGADIRMTNVIEGFYRFRFHDSSKAFSVELISHAYGGASGSELIRNGNFSLPDSANSNDFEAFNWNHRPAMTYGDNYGNSGRVDWRGRSVPWQFFIGQSFGGLWQDVPAGSDLDYETTAWFWMDGTSNTNFGPWTSVVQEVKIEFYSATRGSPLAVVSTNIPFVPEEWSPVTLRASAPTNAAWARTVINVGGAGPKGTLQIDDVSTRVLPRPYQYFSAWNFTTTGTLARGGWVASNGYVMVNLSTNPNPLIYASPSLALRPGGVIASPRIEEGISRLQFYARTSYSGEDDPTDNLTAVVEFSSDGLSFAPLGSGGIYTGVTAQSYVQFGLNVNDPVQKYFRIRVTDGTNSFLVDNIELVPITVDSRYQDFASWTNSALTNAGCHALGNWQLCTGRVFSAGAFVAPSALLPGRSNEYNHLRSPLLTNGYGTISFKLARGNNGVAPGQMTLQESSNGISWSAIANFSGLADTEWNEFSTFFLQSQPRYVRLVNSSTGTPASGGSSLLINEGFPTAPSPPNEWSFSGISSYTSESSSGLNPPSLRFDDTGDFAETPTLVAPTNIQFWMKGQSINTGSTFRVEAFVSGAWQSVANLSNISNGGTTYDISVSTNATRVRFVYTDKVAGNIAFDDVVIRGVSLGSQPPQDLLIDDVNIGLPEEFRTQTFSAWPPKSQYSNGVHQMHGWTITNAIVNGENAFDGQSLRLNTGTNNFIRTASFPDGIGEISFWYAKWAVGDPSPTLAVQYSTNDGAAWVTISNLVINNAVSTNENNGYLKFQHVLNLFVPTAFRVLHTAGAGRALLDDISLAKPQPPADVTILGFHLPEAPFTNDTVSLRAVVSPVYGASVTDVTAFYRVGTSGAFNVLGMFVTNFTSYQSLTNLGPHSTGTVVQYYFRVQFTGTGAMSPRFHPVGGSNAPTFFAIPRSPFGRVWINEVRYESEFLGFAEEDFVELAGPAGFDISGWRLEIVNKVPTTNGLVADLVQNRYALPPGSSLNSNSTPYGFYVAAMGEIVGANYSLSNYLGLKIPVGIRLYNEGGGLEHALAFGGDMNGFVRVLPLDDPFLSPFSVRLAGTGTNYSDFVWTNGANWTPNQANLNQFFGSQVPAQPPDAWISRLIWGTNVTIVAAGNTNNWSLTPWYSTSASNYVAWSPVSPFTITTNGGGTNTIWFDHPMHTNWFLRLLLTHP